MKITSDFAILDVKGGRKALRAAVSPGAHIPVTIAGFVVGTWGGDDSTSQEFEVEVKSVDLGEVHP